MAAKKVILKTDGIFKGYDIKWLRSVGPEHPDFHLVAEYDKLLEKQGELVQVEPPKADK